MDLVCKCCRRTYPTRAQYETRHGACPDCSGRPASEARLRPETREEWLYAMMEALMFGWPVPPNPVWGRPDAEVLRKLGLE
jgi:hypothetical protein